MHVLILDRGVHIDPAAVRNECPQLTFGYARTERDALRVCGEAEILLAMAHEVSDALVSRMPKLRYLCALSAGTDRLQTPPAFKPDGPAPSPRGTHGPAE